MGIDTFSSSLHIYLSTEDNLWPETLHTTVSRFSHGGIVKMEVAIGGIL